MKKVLAFVLALVMVLSLAACTKPQESTEAPTDAPQPSETEPEVDWDGAYIDEDDYKAYIKYDLQILYDGIVDELTADQKTAVDAAKAAGEEAIDKAQIIADVRAEYKKAYDAILACVPVYEGLVSYVKENNEERTNILGILEKYAISTGITGMSLFEDGGYVMYNPRVTLGTENYIVGYGFGILPEGAITADLDSETNDAWKRYYHSNEASDPGTLNYLNNQGSEVGDFYSYIAASFFTNFMNETKDGYDWVPELAMEKPVAVNDDDNDGTATTWKFQVRTEKEGLKYTTLSTIPSRAAFNNRGVKLEDYEYAFKLLLTQSNQLYRGSELANSSSGAIVGAKDFYKGTEQGFNQELWDKVGIKTYEEGGKSYFEVTFTSELTQFYCMYYISSSLYQPVPEEFINLTTVQNYLGYNKDKTETPLDNALALGAYTLEAYVQDQEVVYKKNPNYVYADTKYSIAGVHLKIFPAMAEDPTANLKEFLAGNVDASGIPKEELENYRNDPRTRTTTGTSNFKLNVNATNAETWEYLFGEDGVVCTTEKEDYWDVKPALGNHHFVQALNYSIDRLTFANARGSIPSVDYLSSNYMSDPENGIAYSSTDAHKKAVEQLLKDTDGCGFSLELARDYFRVALAELEADGLYTPGTKENPTQIDIEIAWMYPTHEENYHNEVKNFLETAFNDDSVCGGVYKLSVNFWVGNEWSDVYYNKMMVGQFDIGFGSISGNSLNPLDFISVLSSDQDISNQFTLNWGCDTNDPDVYPIVYKGARWSYDALYKAANSKAIVKAGQNKPVLSFEYNEIEKQADGTYTGSFVITSSLPELTQVEVTGIMCCNYEMYYNGSGDYDESPVDFEAVEENGAITVNFTVPADLAADYAIGSGTSEEPEGYTGFDLYYDVTLDGDLTPGQYYSVEDYFEVE